MRYGEAAVPAPVDCVLTLQTMGAEEETTTEPTKLEGAVC